MLIAFLYCLAGFALLAFAGEALVRGAVTVAIRLNVSVLVIGLTFVAFGTSAPELFVAVQAALADKPDIAIGSVVGSNIANIILVLGALTALAPIAVPRGLMRDKCVMLGATIALVGLLAYGEIARLIGAAMLVAIIIYGVVVYRQTAAQGDPEITQNTQDTALAGGVGLGLLALLIGLAGVMLGAEFLVKGATELARGIGVSEAVIGVSIVAIGTSLPELTVAIMSVLRGVSGVALGSLLGSNIANTLLVLGAAAVAKPLAVAPELANRDGFIMLGATLLIVLLLRDNRTLSRFVGVAFLCAYALYMGLLFGEI